MAAEHVDTEPTSFMEHNICESLTSEEFLHQECRYCTTTEITGLGMGFSVLHINMRSIKNKMDDFQTFLANTRTSWSVICISETWLKVDILKYYNLENYNLFASCRERGEGGGTAIYVHSSLSARRRDDIAAMMTENVFVEIQVKNCGIVKNLVIGCVYRPPNCPHLSFFDNLEKVTASLDEENKLVILAGDFNYNLFKHQDSNVLHFKNLLSSYGYVSLISKATRSNNECSSLLDNIFINDHNFVKSSGVIMEDLSDHFPIFASFSFSLYVAHNTKARKVFDTSKFRELNDYIETKLTNFQAITDPNLACNILLDTFTLGIDNFSKVYKPSRRKTPIKPWITPSILCSINRKNKLYKKFIKNPTVLNENEYKRYRNILANVLREAKRLYFKKSFSDSRGNGKETWKVLKEALNSKNSSAELPNTFVNDDGRTYTNEDIANGFNDYFVSIGESLENSMPAPSSNPISYLRNDNYSTLDEPLSTNSDQIENIIKSLNRVGGGIDRISTDIVLKTYKSCLHHLTHFFNLCLQTATFPDRLKIALVVPIFKTGEKNKFTNYRPISLLPIFSKILEKLLHNNLTSFLVSNNILTESQFGFRKQRGTYMPVALIIDEITKTIENDRKVLGLFLDLKKAFDTVNINILLNKLYFLGIREDMLSIIKSYFTNRKQMLEANGFKSECREVKLGVPQGSILGPLFFILYINDIVNISDDVKFFQFADDTAIIIQGDSYEHLQEKINSFIPNLTTWFTSNRLSLNPSKTFYQIYSLFTTEHDINITLNNVKIKRQFSVRYLGVALDENLKWDTHINNISSILSRNIGVIGRLRPCLSPRELILLYNTLVLPYISYCAAVWGNAYKIRTRKIIKLQKRVMRIIDNKPYRYPSKELFVKYGVLRFPELVIEQNVMILLAFLNGKLPPPLSDLFHVNRPSITRTHQHFSVPFARSNFRAFSLSITAPKAWNSTICEDYYDLEDVPKNKTSLKNYIRQLLLLRYEE